VIINPYVYVAAGGPTGFPEVSDADTTTGSLTSSGATYTVTYPANIAAGDLLLAFIQHSAWAWYVSNTGGFTKLVSAGNPAPTLLMVGKVAAGTETGTFTVTVDTSGTGVWRCIRIEAATWDGSALTAAGGGDVLSNNSDGLEAVADRVISSTPDPPSEAVDWGSAKTLWLAVVGWLDNTTTATAFPTNYGSTAQQSGGGVGLAICRREIEASSEDPGAFTLSASEAARPMTVAIRPT
jgi:hypothetical protein